MQQGLVGRGWLGGSLCASRNTEVLQMTPAERKRERKMVQSLQVPSLENSSGGLQAYQEDSSLYHTGAQSAAGRRHAVEASCPLKPQMTACLLP
jgi:hypothetical protein